MASVKNLPKNLLKRIFDVSFQGPAGLPPQRDDERRILTQVCRRWRRIILSIPAYWSSFDFIQWKVPRPQNLLQLAQEFFGRSGDTPLAICLRGSLHGNLGHDILEFIIRPHARRVWFLSCWVTKQGLRTLIGPGHIDFPILRSIDVTIIYSSDDTIASHIPVRGSMCLDRFQHLGPSLRQLALRVLDGVHPADLGLQVPWGQFTRIDLEHTPIHADAFMRIIEQSLLLEDGTFCINFALRSHDGRATTFRRISVPCLQRLHLRLIEPSLDARIFGKPAMPVLEDLLVERGELGRVIRDLTIYETFVFNAPIKYLTIAEYSLSMTQWLIPRFNHSPRLTYQEMDGILRLTPNLTTLYLCPGVFMNALVLEKLATGEFLPVLEKLAVSSATGWDIICMVRRKNSESTSPGGSSAAHPVSLIQLRLCIMRYGLDEEDKVALEGALKALHLLYGYTFRHVDIPRRESQPLTF